MNYFVITHSRDELEKEGWTLTFFIDWDNGTVENVFDKSMTLTGVKKLHNNWVVILPWYSLGDINGPLKERCLIIQDLQRIAYGRYRCCGPQTID